MAKIDRAQSPFSLMVTKLEIPMTTAVSSELLSGTTKGPPESPVHTPFPSCSDPAQSVE